MSDPKLVRRLEECNKQMLALKRECEEYQILNSVGHIYLKLIALMGELEQYLEECTDPGGQKRGFGFLFSGTDVCQYL